MRRISSHGTFFYKRIFPIILFGFPTLLLSHYILQGLRSNQATLPLLIGYIIIVGVSLYFVKKGTSGLVDEVWEDGDSLVVKKSGQEQRIDLGDITNVNPFADWRNSNLYYVRRVTLSLRRPTIFGDQIAFRPRTGFLRPTRRAVVNELIERIRAARERR